MPDWLETTLGDDESYSFELLVFRLLLALALGVVVAGVYGITQRKPRSELVSFVSTLVLLTILIAMVTLVIGNSVARAFSLVGALAIVRFRTVVEDTRDTAFVIFAVVVGMGVGSGYVLVPLAGIPIVAAAALALTQWGRAGTLPRMEFKLAIRVGIGHDPEALLRDLFALHLAEYRLQSTGTARQGAAVDVAYLVRLRREEAALVLVAALNTMEGVQSVELQRL
jgi:hypothetical protein